VTNLHGTCQSEVITPILICLQALDRLFITQGCSYTEISRFRYPAGVYVDMDQG
jgi:hypothetical protein